MGSPGIPPGHWFDSGQLLIGEPACVRLGQKLSNAGFRGVRVHCKMMTPKGVGGTAHPTRSMMMPTIIDGLPGLLQCTVVEFHFLRLRAVVPLHRTPGGHRTTDVTTGLSACQKRNFTPIWVELASVCEQLRTQFEMVTSNLWRKVRPESMCLNCGVDPKNNTEKSQSRQFTSHSLRTQTQGKNCPTRQRPLALH